MVAAFERRLSSVRAQEFRESTAMSISRSAVRSPHREPSVQVALDEFAVKVVVVAPLVQLFRLVGTAGDASGRASISTVSRLAGTPRSARTEVMLRRKYHSIFSVECWAEC